MIEKDSHRLCHHSVAHNELDLPITLQSTADGLFCHDTNLRSYSLRYRSKKQKAKKLKSLRTPSSPSRPLTWKAP